MPRLLLLVCVLSLLCPVCPAAEAQPGGGTEQESDTIEDPEDDDDTIKDSEDDDTSVPAAASPPPSSPIQWKVQAGLQAALDTAHDDGQKDGFSENMFELDGQATAELKFKPRESIRLELSGQLLYRLRMRRAPADGGYLGSVGRNLLEFRLRDTYVEYSSSWLELAAGMMTLVWGAGTLVSPNDVLSARDLRRGPSIDPASLRIPAPALKVEIFWRRLTLTAVWMPGFIPNQADLFGSDFAFLGPGGPGWFGKIGTILSGLTDDSIEGQVQPALLQTELPDPLRGSVVAGQVALSIQGWDLSAQYAHTLSRSPVYRFHKDFIGLITPVLQKPYLQSTPAEWMQLGQLLSLQDQRPILATYRRFHQVGLSISRGIPQLVLGLDLSYSHRVPVVLGGDTPLRQQGGPWLSSVLVTGLASSTISVRYTHGKEVQVTLEGWYEGMVDLIGDPALGSGQLELLRGGPHRAGLALLARYLWTRMDLTFELMVLGELINRGTIVMPRVTYRVGDHLQLLIGASFFGGDRGSTGRLFSANDQVYVGFLVYL